MLWESASLTISIFEKYPQNHLEMQVYKCEISEISE